MKRLPLQNVHFRIGEPLPFGVFDSTGTLLLARGRTVASEDHLERLYERGAFVHAAEVETPRESAPVLAQAPERLPETLERLRRKLNGLLFEPGSCTAFKTELAAVAGELATLVEKSPDHLLFRVMRDYRDEHVTYSITHAIQCAVAALLVSRRLGWQADACTSTALAALTMNIAMTRLQGELAAQPVPPTPEQRQTIQKHPELAVELLRRLGVQDATWLRAVHEHHETPDAGGYPRGIAAGFEPAEVLRHIDIFLARAKSRISRKAIYPNEAMREIFLGSAKSNISSAVIKEFGMYPPGTFLSLANGATAVVVARGEAANRPIVAELLNKHGQANSPIRRDTGRPEFAVTAIVNAASVRVSVDSEALYV